MTIESSTHRGAILALTAALCASVATANAQTPPVSPLPPSPKISPGQPLPAPGATLPSYQVEKPIAPEQTPLATLDHDVAEWLRIDNRGEVSLAKVAMEKSQNQAVRQFADRMIHDHSQFLEALKPFEGATVSTTQPAETTVVASAPTPAPARPEGPVPAGSADISGTPQTPAAPGSAGTPVRAPDIGSVPTPGSVPNSSTVPTPGGLPVPGTTPAPQSPINRVIPPTQVAAPVDRQVAANVAAASQIQRGLDFFHIQRQIGAQGLADATKQWDLSKPADADIAYIGQQIVMHEMYIETSQVLRRYASLRMKSLIDQGIQMAQAHLLEAKDLMKDLSDRHYSEGQPVTSEPAR